MRTYRFGLPNSDRVIEIIAENFTKAKRMLRDQLQAEGIL